MRDGCTSELAVSVPTLTVVSSAATEITEPELDPSVS
jgi:hypothetical protein